jgi:alpha-L-arabinofuranosidase
MNTMNQLVTYVLAFLGYVAWCVGGLQGEELAIAVKVDEPAHAISPRLYGIFLEDINFGADGGLSAELVKNGGFEFPETLMGWKKLGEGGDIRTRHEAPRRASNPNYLELRSTKRAGVANEGFRGMGLDGGKQYHFTAWVRTRPGETIEVAVRLVGQNQEVLAEAPAKISGSDWQEITTTLTPTETEARARLELALEAPGEVDFDMVSLCPEDTWKGRPYGWRRDLVQILADLQPAFFRFPGGCIVEGSTLQNRYQWKQTLGDLENRRLLINRWNTEFRHRPAPDYYQSFALGFYEYFVMSEELGAEPLPIINCGMACQFNSGELVPLDKLQPYVQDALDLIEFANGPTTSVWGAKRAAMGHPEPFNMKLLGVGNEQWGPQYIERYKAFAEVLKEKHPEIELISGSGPFPNDKNYQYAWPELRALKADIVDEHCYAMPDWFLKASTRYDGFERNGPKVFMGEYAAQSVDITAPNNKNNLRCALAEAAFMTGLERNSDVVVMSSYAPLFGHEDAWQWRPNLIWFDNLTSYATPNYYVQQLFSVNRGDEVLPVTITDSRPAKQVAGRIGLGTYRGTAEFKDIRVTAGNEVLFESGSLSNLEDAINHRGDWSLADGVISQTSRGDGRLLMGDPNWPDHTLSLKARKTAGDEGFVIFFRSGEGGSTLEWNIGGWRNKEHGIQAHLASHSTDVNVVAREPGSVEEGRWYDVKVDVAGSRVKCYLDDQLIHEVDVPAPQLSRVYSTASLDRKSGDIILKVVNVDSGPATAKVQFLGPAMDALKGEAIVLSGKPEAVNTIAEPDALKPSSTQIESFQSGQEYAFPPHSLTVMRLRPAL